MDTAASRWYVDLRKVERRLRSGDEELLYSNDGEQHRDHHAIETYRAVTKGTLMTG